MLLICGREIHCGLIGYQHKKKSRTRRPPLGSHNHAVLPVQSNPTTSVVYNSIGDGPRYSAVESTDDPIAALNQELGRYCNRIYLLTIRGYVLKPCSASANILALYWSEILREGKENNSKMASEPRKYGTTRSNAADTLDSEASQVHEKKSIKIQYRWPDFILNNISISVLLWIYIIWFRRRNQSLNLDPEVVLL